MSCHPSNAVRTRCACGQVISLGRSRSNAPPVITCACGRRHQKAPGGWKGRENSGERGGGRAGCPGLAAIAAAVRGAVGASFRAGKR